jgi:hypothetical protein
MDNTRAIQPYSASITEEIIGNDIYYFGILEASIPLLNGLQ